MVVPCALNFEKMAKLFCGVSILVMFLGLVSGEVVKFNQCSFNKTVLSACKIEKVEILPCPEAESDEPCVVRRKSNSTVVFEFTPNFSTSKLYAQAYSSLLFLDIPLPGQDNNACHFTTCPTVPGQKQSFTFSLPIKEFYPQGPYTAKWRVWTNNNEECCFKTNIKIV